MDVVGIGQVHWQQSWRIIPTMYPAIRLFEGILEKSEEGTVRDIMDATSARVQSSDDAAPLCYFSRQPGRFTTRHFGAYYAARTLTTAIEETVFHAQQFLKRTKEPAMQLPRRVLVATIKGKLHDLRGQKRKYKEIYASGSYRDSRKLAERLRKEGSHGIVYDSVRHNGGQCAAIYTPALLSHCREERALLYEWNGERIERVLEIREFFKK